MAESENKGAKDAADARGKEAAKETPKVSPEHQALADAITAGILKGTSGPRALAASASPELDKTVPGGKYLRVKDGVFVNANGHEIDEDGKILHPEDVQLDKFGRPI